MAEEKQRKVIIEREYVVSLRDAVKKTQSYKKANRAVKALKEFMVQHMKVYDRDLRKIKIDVYLNNEIRFRGMKKPLTKVHVKAIKYDDDTVDVKLVTLPKHLEFEVARKARKEVEKMKKASDKPEAKVEEKKEEEEVKPTEDKSKDMAEKKEASKEAMEETEKSKARQAKHTSSSLKEPKIQRKVMQR